MSTQKEGRKVEIVGINESSRGRSCAYHECCGKILAIDKVVRLKVCRIINDANDEEAAIEAVHVTDGIDSCRVGFLPRDYLDHVEDYHGRLAQITEFLRDSARKAELRRDAAYRGVCHAFIIDADMIEEVDGEDEDERAEGEEKSYASSRDEEIDSPPLKRSRSNP